MPTLRRTLVLRASFLLATFAGAALVACEGSGDSGAAGSFNAPDGGGFDAATSDSLDASAADAADAANAVDAADAGDPARAAELAKMQAHLDSLYAPSDVVHRFTTPLGDKVDCVPFQRQPGFSKVNSLNGAMPIDVLARAAMPPGGTEAGLGSGVDADGNTRGCPSGAVPIRHLELSDLARFDTLEQFLAKAAGARQTTGALVPVETHDHAGFSKLDTPNWGAQSTFNLWKPAVETSDFSVSQLWIEDSIAGAQTAEAGYIDYPLGFDDNPRIFVYSTSDSYKPTDLMKCYNLECKAFIQMADSRVLLGGKFDKTSTLNGEQRIFRLRYQYCPASQCKDWEGWWLHYEGGTSSEWIGFYPSMRYGTGPLHDGSGTRVDFGGEVYSMKIPNAPHTTTDMGSGQPPNAGFGAAAYQSDLLLITPSNFWAPVGAMDHLVETEGCYTAGPLAPAAYGQYASQYGASMFYFGGTGLSASCP